MNRIIGWGVRLLVVIVVVIVLAVAAVRFLLPAQQLVRIGVEQIEQRTGAEVQLGRVTLRFWPRLHFLIEGGIVRTGGTGGADTGVPGLEGFSLRWRRLAVGISWWGLLRHRVELGRIVLEQPELQLVTRSAVREAGTADGTAAVSPVLSLAGLSIHDGRLHWRDLDSGREMSCGGWSQDVDLSRALRLLQRITATDGRAAPAGRTDRIGWQAHIDTLAWRGDVTEPLRRLENIDVNLELALPTVGDHWTWRLRELSLPALALVGEGSLTPPAAAVPGRIAGAWKVVRWDPRVLPHTVASVLPPSAVSAVKWLQRQDFSGGELAVSGTLERTLTVADETGRPPARGIGLEATFHSLPLRPLHHVDRWLADGSLHLVGSRLVVRLDRLASVDGNGHAAGELVLAPVGTAQEADSLSLRWDDLDITGLLRWTLSHPGQVVQGKTRGHWDLTWRGNSAAQWRRTVAGEGEIVLDNGILHADKWLRGLRPYLGEQADLLTIPYRQATAQLRIVDGRILCDDLVLVGPQSEWRVAGWVGLAGDLSARLQVTLPEDFSPSGGMLAAAANLLRDDRGRITVPLRLTGRLAAPEVTVELDTARDRIRSRLQGLLDKLGGKG